jgi:phage gpG-like protein
MPRRVLSARPSPRAIWDAAANGLRIDAIPAGAAIPGVTFSPTLGLTTRRIDKLGMSIRSFHEPLKRSVQEVIIPSIRANFDTEGRPSWEPLSEATYEIAERMGRTIQSILVSSGRLRGAATALARWDIGREAAIFRSLPGFVWYGALHQAGTSGRAAAGGARTAAQMRRTMAAGGGGRPVSSIPARPFVMLQERDTEEIRKVFAKWLGERIDRAWPRTLGG